MGEHGERGVMRGFDSKRQAAEAREHRTGLGVQLVERAAGPGLRLGGAREVRLRGWNAERQDLELGAVPEGVEERGEGRGRPIGEFEANEALVGEPGDGYAVCVEDAEGRHGVVEDRRADGREAGAGVGHGIIKPELLEARDGAFAEGVEDERDLLGGVEDDAELADARGVVADDAGYA